MFDDNEWEDDEEVEEVIDGGDDVAGLDEETVDTGWVMWNEAVVGLCDVLSDVTETEMIIDLNNAISLE